MKLEHDIQVADSLLASSFFPYRATPRDVDIWQSCCLPQQVRPLLTFLFHVLSNGPKTNIFYDVAGLRCRDKVGMGGEWEDLLCSCRLPPVEIHDSSRHPKSANPFSLILNILMAPDHKVTEVMFTMVDGRKFHIN